MDKIYLLIILFLNFLPHGYAAKNFVPKSFRAQYSEHYKSAINGRIKRSRGTIGYKYPGKLRLEILSPDRLTVVSNPQQTFYYTPPFFAEEKGELIVKKTDKTSLSYFFDILKFGLKSNIHYKVLKNKKGASLVFSDKVASKMNLSQALLVFKDVKFPHFLNLRSILITYKDKKKVTITLKGLKTKQKFAGNYFQFSMPKKKAKHKATAKAKKM